MNFDIPYGLKKVLRLEEKNPNPSIWNDVKFLEKPPKIKIMNREKIHEKIKVKMEILYVFLFVIKSVKNVISIIISIIGIKYICIVVDNASKEDHNSIFFMGLLFSSQRFAQKYNAISIRKWLDSAVWLNILWNNTGDKIKNIEDNIQYFLLLINLWTNK